MKSGRTTLSGTANVGNDINKQVDILIAGAGPVGLLLGCLLRQAGLDVAIFEKRATRSLHSKASTLNAYSLAILHAAGYVDDFLARGLPIHSLLLLWQKKRLMRVNYRYLPSRYNYILALSQPDTEALLEEKFLQLGGTLQRSTEAVAFLGAGDVVQVTDATGTVTQCRYLIGCDGPRSTIRQLSNIAFMGEDLDVDLIMFDAKIDCAALVASGEVCYFVSPEHFCVVIPLHDGNYRVYIRRAPPDRGSFDGSAAYCQSLLEKYGLGEMAISDIIWHSEVSFYHRLAETYRAGERVFLCGDAAHVFPPLGGLGMNTGFQDAFGLAWRLTGVLKDGTDAAVLGDYGRERRAIAQSLIAGTVASARLIAQTEPPGAAATDGWLPAMRNRQRIAHLLPMNYSGLAQRYDSAADEACVGQLVPFMRVQVGGQCRCTYDYIDGRAYVLLMTNRYQHGIASMLRTQPSLAPGSVRVIAVDGFEPVENRAQAPAMSALLMRPDGIVCAVAKEELEVSRAMSMA